jgi:hypothetical protein
MLLTALAASVASGALVPGAVQPADAPLVAPDAAPVSGKAVSLSSAGKSDDTRRTCKHGEGPALAIGFLTRVSIPLWRVWDEFFKSTNLIVPVVHSQAKTSCEWCPATGCNGPPGCGGPWCACANNCTKVCNEEIEKRSKLIGWAASHGGMVVGQYETRWDQLRFSCNMTAAMFTLVRAASTLEVNGMRPKWIHFASERCAPLRPAHEVLRFLAMKDRVNHMEEDPFTAAGQQTIPQSKVPKQFQPLIMTSQWVTLWMDDAMALANDGGKIANKWQPHVIERQLGICINGTCLPHKPYWKNASYYTKRGLIVYGAPDEWMWRTELAQRQRKVTFPGLTHVYWPKDQDSCNHMDNQWGSPCAYMTHSQVLKECKRAQDMGYFFARKFADEDTVVDALLTKGHCMQRKFSPEELDMDRARIRRADANRSPEGGSTRGEAMRLRDEPIWEGPADDEDIID